VLLLPTTSTYLPHPPNGILTAILVFSQSRSVLLPACSILLAIWRGFDVGAFDTEGAVAWPNFDADQNKCFYRSFKDA
jgi:hypothetical protein